MNLSKFTVMVLAVALLFIAACDDETSVSPTQPVVPSVSKAQAVKASDSATEDRTPFQRKIASVIAERTAQGLPVPANVSYEITSSSGAPLSVVLQQAPAPGQSVTVVAKTIIEYDNPEQAGYVEWPDIEVNNNMAPGSFDTGFINEGNYTQTAMDQLEAEHPGIWLAEDYRQQSRRFTYSETITINCPDASAAVQDEDSGSQPTGTYADELLMGFTIEGPNLDYHIETDVDIWFFGWIDLLDFWAGFQLDWTIGMRLPMEPSITVLEPMLEGSTYSPTSLVHGLDWSAQDYMDAGVDPEGGNEYILYFVFKFGIFVEILGVDVVNIGVDIEKDDRSSFTTPFGPGVYFPLSSIDIPVWVFDIGVASGGVGLQLTPMVGSDKCTADWGVSGNASGSGSLLYTNPTTPVSFGPVTAVDGPGQADVLMDDFRYYFTQFLLDLALYFELDVPVLGYNQWSLPVTDFDLGSAIGFLYIGTHSGTPGSITNTLAVQNVTPTAVIDRSGAVVLNGTPTFMANKGDALIFHGRSTDPGYDDLTLSWDWGDGPPIPDVSTTYPVPYDVTDSRSHTFDTACAYTVSFRSVDDDGATAQDQVPVVVMGEAGSAARMEGYWQHQMKRNGHRDFDNSTLECYLNIIGLMSNVFNEVRDASTISAAYDVLFLRKNAGSELEQLDRDLLVVWLNFANGVFGYMEMVDINDDGLADGIFSDFVTTAETVRLDPMATLDDIREQTRIMHTLSSVYTDKGEMTSKVEFQLDTGTR